MTTKKTLTKKVRQRHSPAFKEEALALAAKVGVSVAAQQLGLHNTQIYDWRRKHQIQSEIGQVALDQSAEIVRLKCQLADQAEELAIVKKAATYFAQHQK
jgi:transposase